MDILKTLKLILIFGSMFMYSCQQAQETETQTILISGIEFWPNVIQEGQAIKGIDADIASQVMINAGIDHRVELSDSWENVYNQTIEGPNRALLTMGYSAERQDLFKLVGPTSNSQYLVAGKMDEVDVLYGNVEYARSLESIAVVRGWLETQALEDKGFSNLVYYESFDEMVDAVIYGDSPALAADMLQLSYTLPDSVLFQLTPVLRYKTVYYYLAFSKDVDDAVVNACQNALNDMVTERATLDIVKRYMPYASSATIPGVIQLFTEVAEPLNFFTGSVPGLKPAGSSIEIVAEIQDRLGSVHQPELSSWTDAYELVSELPNSALFTTARTASREDHFQWVGPIASMRTCFYTLSDSGLVINSLEEARALNSIATPMGWYTHEFLLENGFQNIVSSAATPGEAFMQLRQGEVEALLLFDLSAAWLIQETGLEPSLISEQYQVSEDHGYIAFSLNTDADLVASWQNSLEAMKADGTFSEIWNRWYAGIAEPVY